ncbi:MAG: FKBP-type peptidyl-prolyl cis-trans isomerase [Mycobacteriales bacterium]
MLGRGPIPRRTAVTVGALVPAAALAACGGGHHKGSGRPDDGSLAAVTVSPGDRPKVALPTTPFSVRKASVRVLSAGTGPAVRRGQNVNVRLALVDGRDGAQSVSNFGKAPQIFLADPSAGIPGFSTGTVGQRVGSRVLVALPPADAWGDAGNTQIGVRPGDTVLLLIEIVKAHTPLAIATGKPVAPKPGLPTATTGASPKITVPETSPPRALQSELLIAGTGPVVKAGQTITAHYTGVLWRNGKVFDSSWPRKVPSNFVIGAGQVIDGWDKTIVGKRIGTRLLVVVPPAEGYGAAGRGEIKGTDTLVFAIDVLDAS